ncbi:hypothetical protein [Halomicrococcus sp. NG-SE-24]|uniref:hypothetical protein n=1 Tax=Halomicrococcus sp. NG-SE-24 TaxID=3436928 RepID=UPI003D96D593
MELRRGDDELDQTDETDTTVFDALHDHLHHACGAVDDLPADVTVDLIGDSRHRDDAGASGQHACYHCARLI